MDSSVTIREAEPRDHAPLGRLMVAAYAALPGFPSPEQQPAYYAMLDGVGALASRPGTTILVAEDEHELVGGVVYVSDMTQYGASGVARAERNASGFRLLTTSPRARGRGIGKALVLACLARARAHGHEQVILHTTRAMRVAWGMYERLGFVRAPELDFEQEGLDVFGFRLKMG